LRQLPRHEIPRMARFRLQKHSSRRGWRVTADSLGQDPFAADLKKTLWRLRDGRSLSLRAIAGETLRPFRRRIRQISDSSTLEHIGAAPMHMTTLGMRLIGVDAECDAGRGPNMKKSSIA
jgi:hypothetical protein